MTRIGRTTTGFVLAALVALASSAARADDFVPAPLPDAPSDAPAPARRWYGWQTVAADAASVAAFAACVELTSSGACLLTYPAAGPAVHLAHGRPLPALLS